MSTNDRGPSEQKVHQGVGDLTITDAIPVGISVLAPDGTILYVNKLTFDLIGLTLDEVKGKSHLERTCHPDDLDRILEQRRMRAMVHREDSRTAQLKAQAAEIAVADMSDVERVADALKD